MKKMYGILAVIFLMIISLSACSSNNAIIGEWAFEENIGIKAFTFRKDGTFSIPGYSTGVDTNGTYKIEEDKLTMEIVRDGEVINPTTFVFKLEKDTLTITDPENPDDQGTILKKLTSSTAPMQEESMAEEESILEDSLTEESTGEESVEDGPVSIDENASALG